MSHAPAEGLRPQVVLEVLVAQEATPADWQPRQTNGLTVMRYVQTLDKGLPGKAQRQEEMQNSTEPIANCFSS